MSPGDRKMHETMTVRSRMTAYMILDEVEFRQEGQAEQHRLQAADPQQQARPPRDRIPPILGSRDRKKTDRGKNFRLTGHPPVGQQFRKG